MDDAKEAKFIFILNPTAGKQKAFQFKKLIENKFKEHGKEDSCRFFFTEKPLHAKELAKSLSEEYGSGAIIYACGGDGTVNEIANGMAGKSSLMSVIPAGTGNDFVKTVYSKPKLKPEEIIDRVFDYKEQICDLGILDDMYFANVASLGFDTLVAMHADKLAARFKFIGGLSYLVAVFICLFKKNYTRIKYNFVCVDEDGEESVFKGEDDFTLAAIGNGGRYGGIFTPCPDARVDDGLLDVCLVSRVSVLEIITLLPRYVKGTHTNHEKVKIFRIKSGNLEGVGEQLLINLDGESFAKHRVEVGIRKHAVKTALY